MALMMNRSMAALLVLFEERVVRSNARKVNQPPSVRSS